MARILLQISLILLPFIMFALYRLATADKSDFRHKWPFAALTLTGLALTSAFYAYMFFSEPRGERTCTTPPRFENGELIPSKTVPCPTAGVDSRKREGLSGRDKDDE
jgi:TRAP-type uncharacterized transport system fused permease subunit